MTGRVPFVQSKAHRGPFDHEAATSFTYTVERRDLDYWMDVSGPIILVLSRPDEESERPEFERPVSNRQGLNDTQMKRPAFSPASSRSRAMRIKLVLPEPQSPLTPTVTGSSRSSVSRISSSSTRYRSRAGAVIGPHGLRLRPSRL